MPAVPTGENGETQGAWPTAVKMLPTGEALLSQYQTPGLVSSAITLVADPLALAAPRNCSSQIGRRTVFREQPLVPVSVAASCDCKRPEKTSVPR